jgi:hypothetical protein
VSLSGLAVAAGLLGILRDEPVLHPSLDAFPTVTAAALVVVLLGTIAAFVSPPPVLGPAHPSAGELADARAA